MDAPRSTIVSATPYGTVRVGALGQGLGLSSTPHCCGHPGLGSRRYVNSVAALESCGRQNVRAHKVDRSLGINYVATRAIATGEEILVDYGVPHHTSLPLPCTGIQQPFP